MHTRTIDSSHHDLMFLNFSLCGKKRLPEKSTVTLNKTNEMSLRNNIILPLILKYINIEFKTFVKT